MVQQLVAKMAAEDIAPIKEVAESHFNVLDWNWDWKFRRTIEKAVGSRSQGLGGNILRNLTSKEKDVPSWQELSFQRALKSSTTAMGIFSELIERQDRENYEALLADSLVDHPHHHQSLVNLIEYYPTPEAIRNWTLMASKRYSFEELTTATQSLYRKEDLQEIFERAQHQYPALGEMRPIIDRFANEGLFVSPVMQDSAFEFTQQVIDSAPNDTRLTELAREVQRSNIKHTVEALHQTGDLSDNEFTALIQTADFLRERAAIPGKHHDEFFFREHVFQNSASLFGEGDENLKKSDIAAIKRLALLSEAIMDNKDGPDALEYLLAYDLFEKLKDNSLNQENTDLLLSAFKELPQLKEDFSLRSEFFEQFVGKDTVLFFRDMTTVYFGKDKQLLEIIKLVGSNALTKERALELPAKAEDVLDSPSFSLAIGFPKLFLETNDGLEFFTQSTSASLFSLDKDLEARIGERIRALQRGGDLRFNELLIKIVPREIEQINKLLSSGSVVEAEQLGWQQLLMGFVRSQNEVYSLPKLSQISADKINTLFNDPKVRDKCLKGLRDSYITYLKSGKPEEVPFSLNLMSEFINFSGGAGPLSQVDSLNTLISSVNSAFSRETTVGRTKLEISQGLASMEERFARERWSNEDRTDFYNISRDILGAAPSIFSDYLSLFGKLSPSQLRQFSKEIYPLYRTKLVLMEKKDEQGRKTYAKEQLMGLRKDIRNFADVFNAGENAFADQKGKLHGEITGLFKERFGIIKIPESFSSEQMRSFTNVSTYLANLHGRTPEKETVLGFYLSLMVNSRWDDFRRGQEINPNEYLVPEKSEYIKKFLQERQRLNPLTAENLGIPQEDMPEFLKLLQQETQNVVIGNIETIDVKLNNIILNLRGLEDLDLYPDSLDKQRMGLLLNWGNKKVGSVVARMYQQLANPARTMQFSEEDSHIQSEINRIIQERGLTLSPQTLKEHFQDGIRPLATVVNLLSFIGETGAEPEVESLRRLLEPSNEVIEIFRRLGEDFKPTSGAMALSQDLSYLDNLIVKRESELKPEEKVLLTEYTSGIRTKIIKLESIYSQIKNKFGGLKQGGVGSSNSLLQNKLAQIDSIINVQTTQQAITSTVTNNLNTIIENIRACLSCTQEGSNNDTNLTFGEMNKLYLYSQTETQERGSISDELVFVEPITRANGSQVMSFVLDRIYGTNTPTILGNHVEVVLKNTGLLNKDSLI